MKNRRSDLENQALGQTSREFLIPDEPKLLKLSTPSVKLSRKESRKYRMKKKKNFTPEK